MLDVMGGAMREYEAQMDRGWASSDERICTTCVEEEALRDSLAEHETNLDGPCSFCAGEHSAPLDVFLENFVDGINFLYDDALNSVPYVSSEGGFVGAKTWETWDLLEDFYYCFEEGVSDKIIEKLRNHLEPRDWVDRHDPDHGPEALLEAAWLRFCEAIKHETRYVFWLSSNEGQQEQNREPWEISPASALQHVGELIDDLNLFKQYDQGQPLFRARTFSSTGEAPKTARSLGTPPLAVSVQGNRMSPAGIPMFYAGETAEVVLDEISVRTEHRAAMVGEFVATTQFRVVDLTAIPLMPSCFDPARRDQRWMISFLQSFVKKISQPIEVGRDQVEYVPTQVMTEYLLRVHWDKDTIRGIRYPSAARQDGICVVMDLAAGDCIEPAQTVTPGRLQMKFTGASEYTANLRWIPEDRPG